MKPDRFLLVISLLGVSAMLVIPKLHGFGQQQRLEGNAQTVESLLSYTHSLALSRGLSYKVGHDQEKHRLVLHHKLREQQLHLRE